jgi:GWxTD domain-containing protein
MKPKTSRLLVASLLAASAGLWAGQQKFSVKDLPATYRKWLEEDVVYIISPKEKDVFLQLSNDRERNMFMEAFWKARDPDLATPQNEYRDEHYRRISYANQWFGRGLTAGGWRSDMGRIYITLGEPKSIEKYENYSQVYPIVVWFYEGMSELGLPNAFNVVFFKKDGAGDYVLYSPVRDGPQKMMPFYNGDMTDYRHAYSELVDVEPLIAEVSMTLIPNEYLMGMSPSVSSEILLGQKIPASAYSNVKDAYAEKLLKYKDVIEVDYTANYIESDALVQVYRDASGQAFVHYQIEPAKLSVEEYQGNYRTILDVNGIVSDARGRTVYQFDRQIPVEMSPDQFTQVRDRLFCFQDMFPLIEGDYKLSLLWKNTLSKEFTSVEASLKVPPARSLTMSAPLLANKVTRNPELAARVKPFTVGAMQLMASPRNDFAARDTMAVYCEFGGLTDALKKTGSLAFAITREDQEIKTVVRPLAEYADPVHIIQEVPLADFPPAYYAVRVSLRDGAAKELIGDTARFFVSLSPSVPRPWILYAPLPGPGDPYYANVIGMQYLRAQDLVRAKALLERAHRQRPEAPEFAFDLCRVLFATKDYEGIKTVAAPFYKDKQRYEFAQFLGESSQALGQYGEAIGYFKDYLTSFGTNISVLNSIGECYEKIGDVQQALTAWKKSLELEPKQDALKAKVADLEKGIKKDI